MSIFINIVCFFIVKGLFKAVKSLLTFCFIITSQLFQECLFGLLFDRTIDICTRYLDVFLVNGVKPFVVFDGMFLPGKEQERNNRKR
jgi:hypothetical protein